MLTPSLLDQLGAAAEERWRAFREHRGSHFHPFVPADLPSAVAAFRSLRGEADSFVELGSGVGTLTVLAGLLGFHACGIELDPWLHECGQDLAQVFEVEVEFAQGTFVPAGYRNSELESSDFLTVTDGIDAWAELGADMDEFDVVYAFPWPEEEALLFDLVRTNAAPGARYLTFGGTEGFRAFRAGSGEEIALRADRQG